MIPGLYGVHGPAPMYKTICEGQTEADARLIAASPDQNRALIALCHEFEQVVAEPTAFTAYNDAKAAIAKAKG